jgi:hypothetical protein
MALGVICNDREVILPGNSVPFYVLMNEAPAEIYPFSNPKTPNISTHPAFLYQLFTDTV